ncbi:hypothetical protein FRB99_001662 [Tulasnella sp. 403]|nr:hypothetical protein FRB99_001662 [Tulasnella sp. 403]
MDIVLDTFADIATVLNNTIHYIALQLGYDVSNSTIVVTIVAIIAAYFTLMTVYRTLLTTFRLTYFFLKLAFIAWFAASVFGLLTTRTWTVVPAAELGLSGLFKLLGWGVAKVAIGQNGVRVNGVPLELPKDYHQYGTAYNKFKSKSNTRVKKSSPFSPFNKPKEQRTVTQQLMSDEGVELMESVEAIQKELQQGFDALKKIWSNTPAESDNNNSGWWWSSNDASSKDRAEGSQSR